MARKKRVLKRKKTKISKLKKQVKKNKKVKTVKVKVQERKEKFKPQLLRGMKDILPEEQKYWDFILEKLEKIARVYGFEKINTPILEDEALFKRSIGMTSDIVEKEMFSLIDKSGRQIALRPEITAGVVRAYIEHGMNNFPQPLKLYSVGQVFRYEKPQAGRYREFNQFNLEVLGSDNPVVESQIIVLTNNLLKELKIDFEVQINSLGCLECRREYQKKLLEVLRYKKKQLCSTCQTRLTRNPMRIFDCKNKNCREFFTSLPYLIDSLCDLCKNHFIKVLENLDELRVPYNLNPKLVRGLDYYTKTVFEFWPARQGLSEDEKAKIALAAGGRYDRLVQELGSKPTPAGGLAFGLERLVDEMKMQKISLPAAKKTSVFLAHIGETAKKKSLTVFETLREKKIDVKEALVKHSLKAQLELANKIGAKMVLILGQDEVSNKTIIIKDMSSGVQEIVNLDRIVEEIKKRL